MILDSMPKSVQYIAFLLMFIFAQGTSMWGQYFTLKYPNMGMIEAFLRAIPFAWLDWAFMSVAVYIGDKYKLVTPTQDTLLLIIVQFVSILVINSLWLKQAISKSDIFCFFIILLAFYISFTHAISKLLGKPIPKTTSDKKEDGDSDCVERNKDGKYHCLTMTTPTDNKTSIACSQKSHRQAKAYHCFEFKENSN